MRIVFDGAVVRCVLITGPTHTYLGLEVQPGATAVVWALTDRAPAAQRLSGVWDDVRAAIADGVASANQELGAAYAIVRAEVVSTDIGSPAHYRRMAEAIVRAVHARSSDQDP